MSPEPGARDYAAQEANQFQWFSQVDFPFIFAFRAELEARAGGNPSWNTGVNYVRQLAKSADRAEVRALYRKAGLSLRADLRTLNRASRISADPAAVRYLARNISFTGRITIPVLSMHTTGDGLVIPQNEQAYASVVRRAGRSFLLRQVFVHRAGHCAFTPAETITAARILLHRMRDRAVAGRDAPARGDERRGHRAWPLLQHLRKRRQHRADRSRVHRVPADPLPASVRPGHPAQEMTGR